MSGERRAVDYDLLIIGDTPAASQAAITAASLKARVAWVTQRSARASWSESWAIPAVMELDSWVNPRSHPSPLGSIAQSWATGDAEQWAWVDRWIGAIAANLEAARSPAALSSLGIDVIDACGEFCRKPTPGFIVDGRVLYARRYLLAPATRPSLSEIEGLRDIEYTTPATLLSQLSTWQPAQRVVVIGGDINALPLAQLLARLDHTVTLIVPNAYLIAGADPDVVRLVQAQLEAEGIRVFTRTTVTQVKAAQGEIWMQVGNHVFEADKLAIAAPQHPDIAALNLDAVGVTWHGAGLPHNAKLQTTNPRVYSCTGQTHSGYFPQIAQYEAQIAVQNALFFPTCTATYQGLPIALGSDPEIAWVGLTEPEATQRYGKAAMTVRRSFNTVPKAQIRSDLTGLCTLIIHRNGTILGAHLAGQGASELISAIALAMQQNIKIGAIARLILPSPTLSEILTQAALDWQRQRLQQNRWLIDICDGFFDWRRAWFP